PDVAGSVLAGIGWIVLSKISRRALLIGALFLAYVIVQALQPFTFLARARPFGWIPFLSFIERSRYSGPRVFLEKTFTHSALVSLWCEAGLSWAVATTSAVALEFALRLAQTRLPGRSAEITDAIMVLILAVVMNLMNESASARKLH